MADKRISQLVDRGTVVNSDVVPIVVSGAVTTNKATISSIQTFMQGNLDLGVTSVGITFGTSGTDINASGSPVTSSGNITINLPTASATNRGALSSADWITFNSKQGAITLTTTGTSGVSTLVGNTLNIPNYTTDLSGYVTLGTAQTITAQKTFTTSGSSDTMIISHGSGSGIALDVIKAGNNEAIRVTKTSGSGNAITVIGGNFEAPTIVKTGGTSTQYLMADGSTSTLTNPVTGTGTAGRVALWNGTNSINSDSDFTYNSSTNLLTIGGGITLTGAQTIQTSTGNLTLATAAGNGNIVLNAHGDGNVTTNDSIFIGSTSGINYGGLSNKLSVASTNYNLFDISRFSNDNDGARLYLGKSRGSTIGSNVIVQNGDLLGTISFEGDCGEGMVPAASISAEVDGVPGLTNDMPGRLIFRTCSDNTIFAAERLRIDSTGAATFSSSVTALNATFKNQGSAPNNTLFVQTSDYASGSVGSLLRLGHVATTGNTTAIIQNLTSGGTAEGNISFPVGNVGIGTTSPFTATNQTRLTVNGTQVGGVNLHVNNVNTAFYAASATGLFIGSATNIPVFFSTNDTERMRITSEGDVTIGDFSTTNTGKIEVSTGVGSFSGGIGIRHSTTNVDGSGFINFFRNTSVIGSINQVGTSSVAYNTTSDYRLKEDLQEVKGLEKVQAIKVYDYKWITDDYRMDGVLAHELAEVLPYAVTGQKDAVDEDGTEKMQGVDYSKIVPILIKAIQELKTEINSLKNQIK
jgi:hypothetical protein